VVTKETWLINSKGNRLFFPDHLWGSQASKEARVSFTLHIAARVHI